MPPPPYIELGERRDPVRIPIIHEDRAVIAVDKPASWMLVPFNWQRTRWNLQAAITSAIHGGYYWAKSRNLKFLKYIHRLDAETTGVLLFGKSPGAVNTFSELFESRKMHKRYLAVASGVPKKTEWVCEAKLAPQPGKFGRITVDPQQGKDAVTMFRLLESHDHHSLIEAKPVTGRTHQIRVHLLQAGHPIVGDPLYGRRMRTKHPHPFPMGLRAVELCYRDPFQRRDVRIQALPDEFLESFGYGNAESRGGV